jgi:RNA polymerase sigma-70 factor (ECF subfamily)
MKLLFPEETPEYEFYKSHKEEFIEIVLKELKELNPNQRNVLVLYHLEDYSYTEIENELNINNNTLKSRMIRGRANLKNRVIKKYKEQFKDWSNEN